MVPSTLASKQIDWSWRSLTPASAVLILLTNRMQSIGLALLQCYAYSTSHSPVLKHLICVVVEVVQAGLQATPAPLGASD